MYPLQFLKTESFSEARSRLADRIHSQVGSASRKSNQDAILCNFDRARAELAQRLPEPDFERWLIQESHNGQRRPVLCEIKGKPFIYKPRSLQIDQVWGEIVSFIGEMLGDRISLGREIRCLNGYGFDQIVGPKYLTSTLMASRYYTRLGYLAGLLWILGGSDANGENVIANGDFPTLIDAELAVGPSDDVYANDIEAEFNRLAIAPRIVNTFGGASISIGASPIKSVQCKHAKVEGCPWCHHVPRHGNASFYSDTFLTDLSQGFNSILTHIAKHKTYLISTSSPISRLEEVTCRVTLRPSTLYRILIDKSCAHYGNSKINSQIENVLHKSPCRHILSNEHSNSLVADEMSAIVDIDVPYYKMGASCNSLQIGSKQRIFKYSPFERARMRIADLSEGRAEKISIKWESFVRKSLDVRGEINELGRNNRAITNI